jgi:hypothetical protein
MHMSKEQKFLLLVVLIVIGAGAVYYMQTPEPVSQDSAVALTPLTTTTLAPAPVPTLPQKVVQSSKKYTKDITYKVPGDQTETIHVTISLLNGLISDIAFTYNKPGNEQSEENIHRFEKALAGSSLAGKKVSEVSLSRVGGASLTTNAFMEAVTKIKTDING